MSPAKKPSELERSFLKQCQYEQLPTPQREVKLIPGRKFSFDFYFAEQNVAVELSGGTWLPKSGHNSGTGIARDATKLNLCQLEGIVCLVFTTEMVREGSFIAVLRRALGERSEVA